MLMFSTTMMLFSFFTLDLKVVLTFLLFSILLLLAFFMTNSFESSYLYYEGNLYMVIKRTKGYILVEKEFSLDDEDDVMHEYKLKTQIKEIWHSSSEKRKKLKILSTVIFRPTRPRATLLIPESALTKSLVVTSSSFKEAQKLVNIIVRDDVKGDH